MISMRTGRPGKLRYLVVALLAGLHCAAGVAFGAADMLILPATTNTSVGDTFSVTVQIQAGASQVDGGAAFINFDPAILQVTGITSGTALPVPIRSTFDNTTGRIDFAAGKFEAFPSGTVVLVTVNFETRVPSGPTTLSFSGVTPRQSDVTFGGASVLNTLADAAVLGCLLEVDGNGNDEVGTDVVYISRHRIGLAAVPSSWRPGTPPIPSDTYIGANVDAAFPNLDVDGNGVSEVGTDLVYIARHRLGLQAVPPSWRPGTPPIPSDTFIGNNVDALCP